MMGVLAFDQIACGFNLAFHAVANGLNGFGEEPGFGAGFHYHPGRHSRPRRADPGEPSTVVRASPVVASPEQLQVECHPVSAGW